MHGDGDSIQTGSVYWCREKPIYKEGTRKGRGLPIQYRGRGWAEKGLADKQRSAMVFWNQPQLLQWALGSSSWERKQSQVGSES